MAATPAGIDRNEEITSLSTYVNTHFYSLIRSWKRSRYTVWNRNQKPYHNDIEKPTGCTEMLTSSWWINPILYPHRTSNDDCCVLNNSEIGISSTLACKRFCVSCWTLYCLPYKAVLLILYTVKL